MSRPDYDAKVLKALSTARPGRNNWRKMNCPFCITRRNKEDKTRALSFLMNVGVYKCWRCKIKGRLGEIPSYLKNYEAPAIVIEALDPPEGFSSFATAGGLLQSAPYWKYLTERGVTADTAIKLEMGYCHEGRYRGRVIVPLLGDDGSWLGWVGRATWKKAAMKYIYPDDWIRGVLLYNEDALGIETDVPCLLVEGVFDELYYHPNSAALLGTPYTEYQMASLIDARRPVVAVLDGDAWELAETITMRLRFEGKRAGTIKLPPKMDPDEIAVDPDIVLDWAVLSLDMPDPFVLEKLG